jgi:hypothetical protein
VTELMRRDWLTSMAAPEYVPVSPVDRPRSYESPDHVPGPWVPDRPAEVVGAQPVGARFGCQGPDQGYALMLAEEHLKPRLQLTEGEHPADAVGGCVGIAMRRASMYGRAPTIHDLTIAFMIWGYLDPSPPAELVELRRRVFAGVGHVAQHYAEGRAIVDAVPEATLRMTPAQVRDAYPARWQDLIVK